MLVTIRPTVQNPILLVTSNSPSFVTLEKHWVVTSIEGILLTKDTLLQQSCQIKKPEPSKFLDLDYFLTVDKKWTKAKPVSPDFIGLTLCQYNTERNLFAAKWLAKTTTKLSQEERLAYYKFAFDHTPTLSTTQAQQLWFILSRISLQEEKTEELQQFLSLWPGINIVNQPDPTKPAITSLYEQSPFWAEKPSANFPNSLELAISSANAAQSQPKSKQPKRAEAKAYPQDLQFVETQPTEQNKATILISTPTCHSNSIPTNQPGGKHLVWVATSLATKTKHHREVIYAQPLEPNAKNPRKEAFALSPLKSTISLLFWDANTGSPNYGQPIIKAINTNMASDFEVRQFLNNNVKYLNETQAQQCTRENQPTPAPQPTKEIIMQIKHCKFCNTQFESSDSKSLYCSPKCRIDFNAGKTFGAPPKRLAPLHPQDTDAPVSQQQFQALSAQVAQLVSLLTSK